MELFEGWPYPAAVAALFVIVLLRAGGTYALGRAARAGARRTRLTRMLDSPRFARAQQLVVRWGAPIVTASFLTVGIQTLVNLAAGLARMPLRRYLPALVLGGALWAVLYATAGFVTVAAVRRLWEVSPVAAVVTIGALAAALGGYLAWQLRASRQAEAETTESDPATERMG